MKAMIRNILARLEGVIVARAHAEARDQLLRMSDRNLADIGVSRKLLEQGIVAWPWQETDQPDKEAAQLAKLDRARAIRELRAYSDQELNDLGLSRADIVAAVTHCHPAADFRRAA